MDDNHLVTDPLVSVIIPCFNHGHYLPTAIESVLKQTYPAVEIVVVDDGSTDNTKEIAEGYRNVVYVYQPNQGLSASRNTGVIKCHGEYLVFLDADDWLYPDAVAINVRYLQQNPEAAFVSGAHHKVFMNDGQIEEMKREVTADFYWHLLQGNYIAMIAAVMFRRRIFEEFSYDVSLKVCEDYDLFLRISRKYLVVHHTETIAAYRRHDSNMSGHVPVMLSGVLKVLKKQKKALQTGEEKAAYKNGHQVWETYFCNELYENLKSGQIRRPDSALFTLLRYKPKLFVKAIISYIFH